jgi:hypothetical protein
MMMRTGKSKLIFGLALILSGALSGCSTVSRQDPCEVVINAINQEDWPALRKLAKPGMRANDYITMWENSARAGHDVRVGKLLTVEPKSEMHDLTCIKYSFALSNKDGTANPHLLQIWVRQEGKRNELVDFGNFGW